MSTSEIYKCSAFWNNGLAADNESDLRTPPKKIVKKIGKTNICHILKHFKCWDSKHCKKTKNAEFKVHKAKFS